MKGTPHMVVAAPAGLFTHELCFPPVARARGTLTNVLLLGSVLLLYPSVYRRSSDERCG